MNSPFSLRLVSVDKLDDPKERAIADIRARATAISGMCQVVKAKGYRLALDWLDQSLYLFERNLNRWPDGRYYLINRSYALWRGHCIAFSLDDLIEIDGLLAWQKKRFNYSHRSKDGFYILESDSFRPTPSTMREYARLVCSIATAVTEAK